MGLTKRKDSYYVEFHVVDVKTLSLSSAEQGGKLKRWKVGSINKTVAKQHEALIKTDLVKGLMASSSERPITVQEWGETYLGLEEVQRLKSRKDRVNIVRLQLIPFFGKKPLTAITPEHVEVYRAQRKRRNGSAAVVADQ